MSSQTDKQQKVYTVIKCPNCQQATRWEDNPFRPFCSRRCRLLDLGCWVDEEYRVPAEDQSGKDEPSERIE